MSEYTLIKNIIGLSNNSLWDKAKEEWYVSGIFENEGGVCLCGHHPITENCILKNRYNNNETIVGNCCVNKFIVKSDKLFKTKARVIKDITKSFNSDYINMVWKENIINDWERDFYLNIWRKRSLSEKQMNMKIKVNKKILGER